MSKFALPQISISPPPVEDPVAEPFSPFSSLSSSPVTPPDDNGFRPVLLTPPPTLTGFHRKPSPLRPAPNGVSRDRFEALLQATRENNSHLLAKKQVGLRKEVAIKAHKTRQDERRAVFLSKIRAPPSPTATLTPVTPPDSPSIFHFTLPSPGLRSPLSVFESPISDSEELGPLGRETWIEEVDYRREFGTPKKSSKATETPIRRSRPLPSLDQISARLGSQGVGLTTSPSPTARTTRLPAFLSPAANSKGLVSTPTISVSRVNQVKHITQPIRKLPLVPVTHTIESLDLPTRERRAHDMMFTLRRRTLLPEPEEDDRKAKWKRQSAPADLLPRQRSGFEHAVLSLPGAF